MERVGTMTEHTTLYRFYDAEDRLLYVGISFHAPARAHQHSKEKPWWSLVARSTMEHFATREDAEQAEREAIQAEKPLHNVVHNNGRTSHMRPTSTTWEGKQVNMRPGLDPKSLVGSFFHSGARPGWQGTVVAEPHPGVYLIELFEWVTGMSSNQTLVRIERMIDEGWQFYDDATWMRNTYEDGLATRWDREREREETTS